MIENKDKRKYFYGLKLGKLGKLFLSLIKLRNSKRLTDFAT